MEEKGGKKKEDMSLPAHTNPAEPRPSDPPHPPPCGGAGCLLSERGGLLARRKICGDDAGRKDRFQIPEEQCVAAANIHFTDTLTCVFVQSV